MLLAPNLMETEEVLSAKSSPLKDTSKALNCPALVMSRIEWMPDLSELVWVAFLVYSRNKVGLDAKFWGVFHLADSSH